MTAALSDQYRKIAEAMMEPDKWYPEILMAMEAQGFKVLADLWAKIEENDFYGFENVSYFSVATAVKKARGTAYLKNDYSNSAYAIAFALDKYPEDLFGELPGKKRGNENELLNAYDPQDLLAVVRNADSLSILHELERKVEQALHTLTPLEERVLRSRFAIGNGDYTHENSEGLTLEAIGTSLEVTRERIRQIEAKAIRKCKHPARSRTLRLLMNELTDLEAATAYPAASPDELDEGFRVFTPNEYGDNASLSEEDFKPKYRKTRKYDIIGFARHPDPHYTPKI